MDARNIFLEGITVGQMKCLAGYNQYGGRNATINKGIATNKYLRHTKPENWGHIV